jgi:hypothetical protein
MGAHAMTEPKKTLPTRSLLQGAPYTHSTQTNLKARFAAIRQQQGKDATLNQSHRHD